MTATRCACESNLARTPRSSNRGQPCGSFANCIAYAHHDHVFFLWSAVAGAPHFSVPASLLAFAGFLVGALWGGRVISGLGQNLSGFVVTTMLVKLALIGVAFVVAMATADSIAARYAPIVLLALDAGCGPIEAG